MARRKKRARKNPFVGRGGKYKTEESRLVRHGNARRSLAGSLLSARGKAKKQHKKMPKSAPLGGRKRLAVASATIALHAGGRGKRRAKKAVSRASRPTRKKMAKSLRVSVKRRTARASVLTRAVAKVKRTAQDLTSFILTTY